MEFWLRCAKYGELYKNINEPLGLYYYSNVTTYSARLSHDLQSIRERHLDVCLANSSCIVKAEIQ